MRNKTFFIVVLAAMLLVTTCADTAIDRHALVMRNNPHVTKIDSLHSLTVGNGRFAFTADATGLQTFPEYYKEGLSLGTYSEWGWHSFPNKEDYKIVETLQDHPLPGHPHGIYAVQFPEGPERNAKAAEWFRANPHRLHLGNIGFDSLLVSDITKIDQTLDMWKGELHSHFLWRKLPVTVTTSCNGDSDIVSASVSSSAKLAVGIRFPYPTGEAADDATCWTADDCHSTDIILSEPQRALIRRTVDSTVYYVEISWSGKAVLSQTGKNRLKLIPSDKQWTFNVGFYKHQPVVPQPDYKANLLSANRCWMDYWQTSGVIDFSSCTDPRASLLERRVVLSQYLLRSQEAQNYPPAETGLTYNTWYGKYHLEMVMWHSFHYALWNKADLLEKQLKWYKTAVPMARDIAARQGFDGIRWMKMTDPSSNEAPSDVGSFIIWQQPHVIYMSELIYRACPSQEFLREYADMVEQTAAFMASFVNYDSDNDRYIIQGACAANESYNEETTLNPAFEMAYWHFGLSIAQKWRERLGLQRHAEWDEILAKLAPLTSSPDGIYLPAEKGRGIPDFVNGIPAEKLPEMPAGGYINGQRPKETGSSVSSSEGGKSKRKHDPFYVTGTSSENLLAYGMLPESRLIDQEKMQKTLVRAAQNWNWSGGSWSWNYPTLAMNATRLLQPEVALRAITMDNREDLLLPSGNNYRSTRLRSYLPGNGGLLLAVSMMCAGWDGCSVSNPGFPKDGKWNVRWEGLHPMP